MNSGSQLSEIYSVSQMAQVSRIAPYYGCSQIKIERLLESDWYIATIRNDCHKFRQCPLSRPLPHAAESNYVWYVVGCTSNIFSARVLWSQIPRSGGVWSADWHSCQTGNQTRWHLIPAQIQKKTKFLWYLRLKTWSCFEQITILQYNTALLNVVWPKESVLKVVFT